MPKPTLRERVEELEGVVRRIQAMFPDIQGVESTVEGVKEKIERVIQEKIDEIEKAKGSIPEILIEICKVLEEELGINLAHIRKMIGII